MKQVHCDGCEYSEDVALVKSKKRIQEDVVLTIVKDPRGPEGTDKYTADLCTSCMSLLLHTYFKIPEDEKLKLALPTFIEPLPREEDYTPEPESLKA
jgi:hypothetical protein